MRLELQFFGIPVRVHVWFLLTALVLGAINTHQVSPEGPLELAAWLGCWGVLVFQGVFCHELGHAFVGRAFGLRPFIELIALGGQTGFHGTVPLTPAKSVLISAAGPAVSVVLGMLALAFRFAVFEADDPGWGAALATDLVFVNLVWGLFNLLPVLPLDGGQILMGACEWVSPRRGRRIAAYLSLTFAAVLTLLLMRFGLPLPALLAALCAYTSYQLAKRQVDERLSPAESADPLVAAQAALEAGQGERLFQLGTVLLARASTPEGRDQALHLIAWSHILRGEPHEAERAIESTSEAFAGDPALRGAILLDVGRPDDALPHFEEALERGGSFVRARMVQAIIAAARFEEAVELFGDDKGRDFAPAADDKVYQGAWAAGRLEAAVELAKVLFRRMGDGGSALEVARSLARNGRPEEGLTWLEKARIAGFSDLEVLESDPLLAPIRALPGWEDVRAGFGDPTG
jgi:Zn-dependent protease